MRFFLINLGLERLKHAYWSCQFSAVILGGFPLPATPAPKDPMPSFDLNQHLHPRVHSPQSHIIKTEKESFFLKKKKSTKEKSKPALAPTTEPRAKLSKSCLQEMCFQTDNTEGCQECWEGTTCSACLHLLPKCGTN